MRFPLPPPRGPRMSIINATWFRGRRVWPSRVASPEKNKACEMWRGQCRRLPRGNDPDRNDEWVQLPASRRENATNLSNCPCGNWSRHVFVCLCRYWHFHVLLGWSGWEGPALGLGWGHLLACQSRQMRFTLTEGSRLAGGFFSGLLLRENTNHLFDGIVVSIIQCLL